MMRSFPSLSLVLSFLIIGLLFSGCTKYADGPTLAFSSRKSRAVNDWNATTLSRNNIDEFLFYNSYSLSLRDNNTFEWSFDLKDDTVGVFSRTGTWKFISVDAEIQLTFDGADPENDQEILVAEIKRLAEDELWLVFLFKRDIYEIQFE